VRLPFPERVPLDRVAVFAGVLFAVQIFEGTALYFSVGCAAFVFIAAIAFNTAGGLTRTSGAYVFFYSTMVVIIGICYKAYLGEPADSNLVDPGTDIAVYVAGITAMLGAVIVSRRFARKAGLLQNVLKVSGMYRASVGCIVFGIFGSSLIDLLGEEGVSLQRIFLQINQLIPLGIIIGVIYEIRHSRGTRSINLPTAFAIVFYFFFLGLLGYSKQGMLTPLMCWALPVCALRYRLSGAQILSCLLGVSMIFYFLVPYAQYGRGVYQGENPSFSKRVSTALSLIEHPGDTRKKYLDTLVGAGGGYYNSPQGFWDRLQFISVDDGLVNATDHGHVFGLWPVKACFLNAIPHIIWPDKPDLRLGNTYTHEFAPNMPEEDTTTGISYSAIAEGYHWAKWVGVLIVAPLIWVLAFLVFDLLFGDLRATPWGLLVLAELGHAAPEGMLSGLIGFMTIGAETLIFCAVFATWIAPHFATFVLGPERSRIPRVRSFSGPLPPQPNRMTDPGNCAL
jgi:hypothetical protein